MCHAYIACFESQGTGLWTFFQPCQRTSEPGDFSDTILNDRYFRCNHLKTSDMKGQGNGIGSQMSAAMSWQSSQTSLAWASPSKRMGLTFQVMIDDVLRARPANVMLPSFDGETSLSLSLFLFLFLFLLCVI